MKSLAAAFMAAFLLSGCAYNYQRASQVPTHCIIEHELAHAGGWPGDHPGAVQRAGCGGLIMPPHTFPVHVPVNWHWVPDQEIPRYCGINALACTYIRNPAEIFMPLSRKADGRKDGL